MVSFDRRRCFFRRFFSLIVLYFFVTRSTRTKDAAHLSLSKTTTLLWALFTLFVLSFSARLSALVEKGNGARDGWWVRPPGRGEIVVVFVVQRREVAPRSVRNPMRVRDIQHPLSTVLEQRYRRAQLARRVGVFVVSRRAGGTSVVSVRVHARFTRV